MNISLYLFDYKPKFQALGKFGVMANEAETIVPKAVVVHSDGYRRVNYAMLGIGLSGRRVH